MFAMQRSPKRAKGLACLSMRFSPTTFFANNNDDPELLMEAAEWWIRPHKLDHFEKAVKVRGILQAGNEGDAMIAGVRVSRLFC